jgi:hypothetical protein
MRIGMDGDHDDMYYTAPAVGRVDVRIIGDDRFKDEPITVSPKQTKYGTLMLLEGDIIVGKREQLMLANLYQLREEAKVLNLGEASLRRSLSPEMLAIIKALQAIPSPGAEQEHMLRMEVTKSRISPLVSRTIQLVEGLGEKDGFFPQQ